MKFFEGLGCVDTRVFKRNISIVASDKKSALRWRMFAISECFEVYLYVTLVLMVMTGLACMYNSSIYLLTFACRLVQGCNLINSLLLVDNHANHER